MILRQITLLILSLLLMQTTTTVSATTLHYVGHSFFFNSIPNGGNPEAHVEATVTFSTPLTEGAVLFLSDISSFSLNSAGRTITSDAATFAFAEFTIGPDGLPSEWGLGAEVNLEGNSNPEQISTHGGTTSTIFGQTLTFDLDIFFIDDPRPNDPSARAPGGGGSTVRDQGPGTWTVVPEPSSAFSCGLALALLTCLRRPPVFASFPGGSLGTRKSQETPRVGWPKIARDFLTRIE